MPRTQLPGSQILDGGLTDADMASTNKDGVSATPSLRTLGTGAQQACAGNDARLSNQRDASSLQGRTLSATAPIDGQVLTWVNANSDWEPKTPSSDSALSVVSKTANYTVTNTDDVILADASGGTFTVTLHDATIAIKKRYTVKKKDTSGINVTIATTSSQTIDGQTTQTLYLPYAALELVPDGSNWQIT